MVNEKGEILLVRHRYGEGWLLPGGRANRNESYENTIHRELKEELGVTFTIQERLGEYMNTHEYKKDTIVVFIIKSFTLDAKHHFEIESWQFFSTSSLPNDTSPGTRRKIEEWLNQRAVSNKW